MGASGRRAITTKAVATFCTCLVLPSLALAQNVEGRFFTPKNTYLAGEPIFVIFELTNKTNKPVWVDGRFGEPCFGREQITVLGANRARHDFIRALDCYGGWAGSCGTGVAEMKPGQMHLDRILVNHYYQLDQPGIYEVKIVRKVPTYLRGSFSNSGSPVEARADIGIQLVQANRGELKAAFQPVLKDLESADREQRWSAVQAITELAQPFLEQTIINLSKNPADVWAAIEGLYKLNTPQARERLAELAEHGKAGLGRERAMQALAALGDKHYLRLFYRLGRNLEGSEQGVAIESAGLLGGGQAVPFLSHFLSSPGPTVRMAAIRGLAGTANRSALAPLIEEIRDADPNVRQFANAALAQLTHLSTTSNALDFVPNPAQTYQKWLNWWLTQDRNAAVYGPTDCAEPTPLN
jgi:hypothetical protein